MNKIILCEGETDAILLSYYLGKLAGWKFCKKAPASIAIKPDTPTQSAKLDCLREHVVTFLHRYGK